MLSFATYTLIEMIEINKAFHKLTDQELTQLIDVPIWMSLLAAYAGDGKVSGDERADAVRLAHLRTFTSPKSIRGFYEKVDKIFDERFDILNKRVPSKQKDIIVYIEAQVKKSHALLAKIDEDLAADLEESLESFYKHVFNADKSFFQYFALPVFSSRLDRNSGKYDFDEEAD